MLNIKCPYCGFRDESEFSCGGEAHIIRPGYEIKLTDEEWMEEQRDPRAVKSNCS